MISRQSIYRNYVSWSFHLETVCIWFCRFMEDILVSRLRGGFYMWRKDIGELFEDCNLFVCLSYFIDIFCRRCDCIWIFLDYCLCLRFIGILYFQCLFSLNCFINLQLFNYTSCTLNLLIFSQILMIAKIYLQIIQTF